MNKPTSNRQVGLLQLIQDNLNKPRQFKSEVSGDTATLFVYDVIGGLWGGVDATAFNKELASLDVKQINLRIHSPGGDAFDGRAIATALSRHPAHVTAYIDGLAASAATTVALAADEIVAAKGTMFMVHNAWTLAIGNRHELLDMAGLLEKLDGQIAADYAERTGASLQQAVEWMDQETWFTAEEALDAGFFDRVETKADMKPANTWNLSAYRNAPAAEAPEEDDDIRFDREQLERRLSLIGKVPA